MVRTHIHTYAYTSIFNYIQPHIEYTKIKSFVTIIESPYLFLPVVLVIYLSDAIYVASVGFTIIVVCLSCRCNDVIVMHLEIFLAVRVVIIDV